MRKKLLKKKSLSLKNNLLNLYPPNLSLPNRRNPKILTLYLKKWALHLPNRRNLLKRKSLKNKKNKKYLFYIRRRKFKIRKISWMNKILK